MNDEVIITHLDEKGHGRAHLCTGDQTKKIIVVGGLPQEKVRISSPQKGKRRVRRVVARIEEVLEPSPCRVQPRCRHVGACGGCLLQHMSYPEQLRWKQSTIDVLFAPYKDASTECVPCLPSSEMWMYRNKMEFTFSQDLAGNRYLGLYALLRNKKIETITSCQIGPEWSGDALERIFQWWKTGPLLAYHPHKDTGSLRTVTFRSSPREKNIMIILTVSGRAEWALKKEDLQSFVAALLPLEKQYGCTLSCILRIHQALKGNPTQIFEMVLHGPDAWNERYSIQGLGDVVLQFSPQSFSQPNTLQADHIYSTVLQMLDLKKEDVVWDLFCGVGGFGLFASSFVKKVIGIEVSPDSAYDAQCNKDRLGVVNFTIEKGDVFQLVQSKKIDLPTKIVVDPPRSGLGEPLVQLLHDLSPQLLVYVSCNPESQSRDCALFHSLGWRIRRMQPVDQFPHTPHLENILLLEKSANN